MREGNNQEKGEKRRGKVRWGEREGKSEKKRNRSLSLPFRPNNTSSMSDSVPAQSQPVV